jgi:alpha-beta hydrolase superfamily lysophospholipase
MSNWASMHPVQDPLGPGYEMIGLDLDPDDEGPVAATLIRRTPDSTAPNTSKAVLYVHGYNDYFFQTHLADYFAAAGYVFYALDLRKSGRSLRSGQTAHFMRRASDHIPELQAAFDVITADGCDSILLNAHSTGGLIIAAWLADADEAVRSLVTGVILNSPFLDLSSSGAVKDAAVHGVGSLAKVKPYAIVQSSDLDLYGRSVHKDYEGEWDFDLTLKTLAGRPIRAAWLDAVRKAQQRVRDGAGIRCPVLVLCSDRSVRVQGWNESLRSGDAVLDVERISRASTALGSHVTCIRVTGAMHDVVLSAAPVRAAAFKHMTQWIGAYQ